MLLQKKKEQMGKETADYIEKEVPNKQITQEEEKNERIKKGLAAMNLGKTSEDIETENKEKRKLLMGEIRDALINGEDEAVEVQTKKKKKKKIKE